MAVSINGTTITLTRGDTLDTTVKIYDSSGTEYVPEEGEIVRFALKAKFSDLTPVIEKELDIHNLQLRLESNETKLLDNPVRKGSVKTYYYDIQITHLDGTVDTFISEAELNVTPEVH